MTKEEIKIIEDFIEDAETHDKVEMKTKCIGAIIQMIFEIWQKDLCNKCESGNPCLYCKHQFEPQESEEEE